MIVLDAGAWARALSSSDADAEAARELLSGDGEWVLPSHGPVETVRTIRRLEFHRFLSTGEAEQIVEEICSAEVITVPPEPWLLRHIWELRHNISPYDAAYLVLARHFDCPLITFDERLGRAATSHGVDVTVPQAVRPQTPSPE